MSASVNKVILIGNLGKDPELRHTSSGTSVATFSLATRSGGGKDKETVTEWHSVVVFDKLADLCAQYLQKGRQVYIEGRLQTRNWEDKDGLKRSKTEVIASQVSFLGSVQEGQGGGNGQARGSQGGGYDDDGYQPRQQQRQNPQQQPRQQQRDDEWGDDPPRQQRQQQGQRQGGGQGQGGGYGQQQQRATRQPDPAPTYNEDDDIPF